jgi:multiple sugar transport system ATP-binding protein
VEVGVRPEDVTLAAAPGGGLEARVRVVEPMGSETVLLLDCAGERVTVRTSPDHTPEPGATVWIAPDLDRAVFFDLDTGRAIPSV